jgi:SAM-dependent methyltransferase
MDKLYVQYGCGLSAPEQWVNFDASPTLRIQKIPVAGRILKKKLNTVFPENVRYGDIIKGLPVADNSCNAVYCSHTLEHLSLTDFRKALKNTYRILKPGGIFRCVVPDLENAAREYLTSLENGDQFAAIKFMDSTLLGVEARATGVKGGLTFLLGNANHLWMWDHASLSGELKKSGFDNLRICSFNDSEEEMFKLVEDRGRFVNAVAIECKK